jgi:hypothetical protein
MSSNPLTVSIAICISSFQKTDANHLYSTEDSISQISGSEGVRELLIMYLYKNILNIIT